MRNRHVRPVFAALLTLLAVPSGADADVQLWTEAGLDKKLGKKLEIDFEQHLRFDQDVSRVAAVMPEVGISYQLQAWLSLGAGYRLAYERRRRGDMEIRHRLHVEAQPRVDAGPFRLRYRLRFQERIRDAELRHSLRNRLSADWRVARPWVPRASVELFHRLGDGDTIVHRKVRLSAGVKYELGKGSLAAFYILELTRDDPDEPNLHALSLGFHREL
jgi:hypothetical protein